MATVEIDLSATITMLQRLVDPDPMPLMEKWEQVIVEDNERGVLSARTDWRDQPLKPVTYRPKGTPVGVTRRQRNNARGVVSGIGPMASGLHNNLTRAEYERLSGPPMAPRGADSRVITNLLTAHGRDPANDHAWFAMGAWAEVVDVEGRPFLDRAFAIRDLAGVRQWGIQEAINELQAWVATLLR
jgi:hypothetical protein